MPIYLVLSLTEKWCRAHTKYLLHSDPEFSVKLLREEKICSYTWRGQTYNMHTYTVTHIHLLYTQVYIHIASYMQP